MQIIEHLIILFNNNIIRPKWAKWSEIQLFSEVEYSGGELSVNALTSSAGDE